MIHKKHREAVDMIHGPLWGKMVVYTLPILGANVLQYFYNVADTIVVGQFASDGEKALAAVGSTGALINLIIGLLLGLAVGACSTLAQDIGARSRQEAEKTVHTSILTSVLFGVPFSLFGILLARPLLMLMQIPPEVLEWAVLYMRIYFVGVPFALLYNFGAGLLRANGDTRYPFFVLLLSGILNVALNLLLVIVFRMDVAGVAIATVASQILSAVMVVWKLRREPDYCHLRLRSLHINRQSFIRILRVGIPTGVQSSMFSLSNVLLQSSINSFGQTVIAGNTAAGNIENIIYMANNAVYQTALTFVGQNYGARSLPRIRRVTRHALLLILIVSPVLSLTVNVFSEPLLSLYAPGNAAAIASGVERIRLIASFYLLAGFMEVMSGALRGMNRSFFPMIVSLLGVCGLRVLWILFVFPIPVMHTIAGLFLVYPISWGLVFLVNALYYLLTVRHLKKPYP